MAGVSRKRDFGKHSARVWDWKRARVKAKPSRGSAQGLDERSGLEAAHGRAAAPASSRGRSRASERERETGLACLTTSARRSWKA